MSYRLVDHMLTSTSDLPDAEFRLLLLLSRHADDDGNRTFPSVAVLAAASGKQPRAIKYSLRRLRLAGWIDVVARGGGRGRATRYRVNRSQTPMLPLLGTARRTHGAPGAVPETVQAAAPFQAAACAIDRGGRKKETVQRVTERVQSNVLTVATDSRDLAENTEVTSALPPPNRLEDPVIQKQNHPYPPEGGIVRSVEGLIEALVAQLVAAAPVNASGLHDLAASILETLGCRVEREVLVPDRGDGRRGRVDLVVRSPHRIAIELDRAEPRQKSLTKLEGMADVDARVVLLREAPRGRVTKGRVLVCGLGATSGRIVSPRGASAWERRRAVENATLNHGRRRWRCHHASPHVVPCSIQTHCFLKTLREVRADPALLAAVPDPVRSEVEAHLADEAADAGLARRQA